jgi:NTP pyrophosphatase (non-canonical NTP hydrolase)
MELNEYQAAALETDQTPAIAGSDQILPLLGLAGEAGQLISEYKKYLRDGDAHQLFPQRVAEELGDILWYLASAANKFGIDLNTVAELNLRKARESWSGRLAGHRPLGNPYRYDDRFPPHERFNRQFAVLLNEFIDGDKLKVRAICDGVQMGQDLTDNAYEGDGYRFHDVFHLACIAGLGWSPVSRRNLGRKRRSDPRTDEVEDGGRAIVIEEGISALVFSYAIAHSWLKGVSAVDHDLLRTIKSMTAHLEVSGASIGDWERTILMGYDVWRDVFDHRGGTVDVDLDQRSISFRMTDKG